MKNKILIIQHEDDSPPGTTLEWARLRQQELIYWRPASEQAPPETTDLAGVVICGGSMDAFEEDKFPWLKTEKTFIRALLENKIKVFGLCLGSQLLAEMLGGRVYQHVGWEIGFVPGKTSDGVAVPMFHWHHCTFDLPAGAELFIQGEFCRNQAFKVGEQVVATQFHPEATPEWIRECAEEVRNGHRGNVQSGSEILKSLPQQKELQAWYFQQLDNLFQTK